MCAVYDRPSDRTWRELDTIGRRTYVHARVPRADCPSCGVRQVEVPWARPGSHFTLQMEIFIVSMFRQMRVSTLARMMHESAPKVWRVVRAYVDMDTNRMIYVAGFGTDFGSADHPTDRIGWGRFTKLRHFVTLADTVERNIALILQRFTSGFSNAVLEEINSLMAEIERRARGFGDVQNPIPICYPVSARERTDMYGRTLWHPSRPRPGAAPLKML